MTAPIPAHLTLYHDAGYFVGDARKSGYDDYRHCRGVLHNWAAMVSDYTEPTSVLDVGAAYGYVVEWFRDQEIPAVGIEPSAFARAQAPAEVAPFIWAGALPELAATTETQFDVVTCTEVLEHVPEELVGPSLRALADRASRLVVCLIMLDLPGADGDEGHICLKPREWWEWQFMRTCEDFNRRRDLEELFNVDPYSGQMAWRGRFFVYERDQ